MTGGHALGRAEARKARGPATLHARKRAAVDQLPTGEAMPKRKDDIVATARRLYRFRRRRDSVLGSYLFGEPAWDLLLELFIAEADERRVSISNACVAAAVPSTTAIRWIKELESHKLVRREDDPDDARRTYVRLTGAGRTALKRLLGGIG